MKISELIENLRQIKSEVGNVNVYIYDCHDAEYDHVELELEHIHHDEDNDGQSCIVISSEED
jgi:hypothetical protein